MSETLWSQEDSTNVLTFNKFYEIVIYNHPIAKQGRLLTEEAAAQVRLAQGGFDPKLDFSLQRKDFNQQEYYNKLSVGIKLPTWLGLTPEIGLNQNEGIYLNPENYISDDTDNRQTYAGVSLTLGKGLFIDERRAMLQKANLFTEMAEAEQVKTINYLLLSAAKDYWEWYYAVNNYKVVEESMQLAEDIFNRTKLGFSYGEIAAIDTVLAKTNFLMMQTELVQATILKNNTALKLSTYLWDNNGFPVDLPSDTSPQVLVITDFTEFQLNQLVALAQANHPEILKLRIKNETHIIDRRLARESLKPQLDLKYFLLNQPWSPDNEFNTVQWTENYSVGIDFSFPLLLRKERAKIKQADIKLQDNTLEISMKERDIMNEIQAHYFELINTAVIIEQGSQMVANYRLLVEAERLNLANGESDLFKLNSQLAKLLESQSKLVKNKADYQKKIAQLFWASGIKNLQFN